MVTKPMNLQQKPWSIKQATIRAMVTKPMKQATIRAMVIKPINLQQKP